MKLGLFGGAFDPIHRGHLEPVRAARDLLGLDRVLYLPTARPPHKPDHRLAPPLARLAMVELALLDEAGLYASPFELLGDGPAYTIDSVAHFAARHPAARLHLLLGTDSFLALPTWRRWRELAERATLVVLTRPGWESAAAAASPELAPLLAAARPAGTAEAALAPVVLVSNPPVDLSASALRAELVAGREPPVGALPGRVLDYIRKYDLYR